MKRDNQLDSVLTARREGMRDRGLALLERKMHADGHAVVGSGCDTISDFAPECYDLDYLDTSFNPDVFGSMTIAAGAVATLTADPLTSFVIPVAVAALVWDVANPSTPLDAWILDVAINGCHQLNFTNATPTVAGATAVLNTQLWNPFARSCKACPVTWGMYANGSGRDRRLTVLVCNPNAIPIGIMLFVYGKGFDCCPAFFQGGIEGSEMPRRPRGPSRPAAATGNLTTGGGSGARRALFGQ